jgi:hypothetical protein
MSPLEAHHENVKAKGALRAKVDFKAAIAELQAALAKVDASFKPKNDARTK